MAGPNWEHGTSYPRRQQDSDHGYLSLPFFSHYTDLGFTSCAGGQVSSPGLSTLGSRFPDKVPDVAAVMLVTCRRLKWQLFDVPLKTAHGKGMDISRADSQAVPRSVPQSYAWPCKLDGDARRTEGKNQRKVQKKNIKKKKIRKKEMIALLGIPVVNSWLFWRGKQDTYGQACTQEHCSSSPSEREANPSRNGPNSH